MKSTARQENEIVVSRVMLEKIINAAFKKAIEESFDLGIKKGRAEVKNIFKQTEKRLYAYPVLKKNIARYYKDIEDIKKEDMRKSSDFVLFVKNSGGGEKLDIEELRAAKILLIEQKIARDQKEINEIDIALEEIQSDEYYQVIKLHYFKKMSQEDMTEQLHCDKVTLWRNRKKLINMLNVGLYGADAL